MIQSQVNEISFKERMHFWMLVRTFFLLIITLFVVSYFNNKLSKKTLPDIEELKIPRSEMQNISPSPSPSLLWGKTKNRVATDK